MFHINHFRVISLLEGLSFLALLFAAMPAKYYFGLPEAVSVVGMAHGLLFMMFVLMATLVALRHAWSDRYTLMVIICGILPFACFFLDKSLKRQVEALA